MQGCWCLQSRLSGLCHHPSDRSQKRKGSIWKQDGRDSGCHCLSVCIGLPVCLDTLLCLPVCPHLLSLSVGWLLLQMSSSSQLSLCLLSIICLTDNHLLLPAQIHISDQEPVVHWVLSVHFGYLSVLSIHLCLLRSWVPQSWLELLS